MGRALFQWLDERTGLSFLSDVAKHKQVPVHRHSIWYYLGGITLFFFVVQVLTGILLMLYYRPSADEAYESVQFIMTQVSFGWLVRNIHAWSANLMIGAAFIHLFSVFFLKAYRSPREMTWIGGALLLFLALGFGFSGYLLPWNTLAYFATRVGTDIPGTMPVIGEWVMTFLRGGKAVTGGTLSRFYGWHVAILPAIASVLLGLHLYLVQRHGMSVPPGEKESAEKTMPFVPNFLLRDIFGWTIALALLAALAAYSPWELGLKADPFAPAPADIKPEWYFMFMFQTLKLIPGGAILGVEYEAIAVMAFGACGLALLLVPFVDRNGSRGALSRAITGLGWAGLAYMAVMTAWGYHSPWPIVAPAVVIGLVFLMTRKRAASAAVILLACALAGLSSASADPADEESCVTCHKTLGEISEELAAPALAWEKDVHFANGLQCVSCHGGDPSKEVAQDSDKAMDPKKGFVGAPERGNIPEFCGKCHADADFMKKFNPGARVDQLQEYRTSVHGEKNAAGDQKVATCVSCHHANGSEQVSSPKSPVYPTNVVDTCGACHGDEGLMKEYGLDNTPVTEWKESVHAEALLKQGDISAPTCNDCHGNHGAVPPGVTSLAFVCGSCHGREGMLFRASFKKELFDEMDAGECVVCHSNHEIKHPTDNMIGTGKGTVCSQCHEPGDTCDQQSVEIRAALDRYAKEVEEASSLLEKAERAGMEVSEPIFNLKKEGVSGLVETRALIHSFDTERLVKSADEGVVQVSKIKEAGRNALKELAYRRKGLAVSLVLVFLFLGALYLKIRDVDRTQGGAQSVGGRESH